MKRRRPRKYADRKVLATYAEEHLACASCWRTWREPFLGLSIHHFINGKWGRPDMPEALLRLCGECHDRLDKGRENLAVCLKLKEELGELDLDVLQAHVSRFGRELLPDVPTQLPPWITQARAGHTERNGR